MKKIFLLTVLAVILFSCKSRKNITDNKQTKTDSLISEQIIVNEEIKSISKGEKIDNLTYLRVVNDHYAINKDFNTLQINAEVDFKNQNYDQAVSVDIRIQKGNIILISIKKIGIVLSKILITQEKVSYYNVLNSTFYDGNFEILSNFLGTDLNYNQVENLLIGTSFFDLAQEQLITKFESDTYKLYKETDDFSLIFTLDNIARMKQEVISQKNSSDKLVIDYLSYQDVDDLLMPSKMLIRALQQDETTLRIHYKKINVNPKITFTYKMPNGLKAINF